MKNLDHNRLETHVKVLGWLNIVGGVLLLVLGFFTFIFLTGLGMVTGESDGFIVMTMVGIFSGFFMGALAIPGILAGIGLLKGKNWGRILAIIVGGFNLLSFPIGTVFGLYTFWVLFQNDAPDYFRPLKAA
ncbi:MAG: hypothetical protein KDE48_21175 [Anaerolineales bacterium]|nr:hypothetical protein [Anaerolineales bacterium]